jgi:hypothetical protein
MRINISVRGLQAVTQRLARVERNVKREVGDATERAANMVAKVARKRLVVSRSLNQQDANKPRKLSGANPVRRVLDKKSGTAVVEIRSHYSKVRIKGSGPVRQALKEAVGASEVTRATLKVKPRIHLATSASKKKNKALKLIAAGKLRTIRFAKNPRLLKWGQRQERGQQVFRHTLYLRGNALQQIAGRPTIQETAPIVISIYRDAVAKGVRS